MGKKTLKGYKVTNVSRSRICGVACTNFQGLLQKGCSKLMIANVQRVTVHLQDGTIVDNDSYFLTLTEQTVFVFSKEGEEIVTGADIIYNALKLVNLEVLKASEAIAQFFDSEVKVKVRVLSEIIQRSSEGTNLTMASTKNEHPDWFDGIESNSNTKEEYLEKRCKDRMRNYLYKTISDLRSTSEFKYDISCKKTIEEIIMDLKTLLAKNNYCGAYFIRGSCHALCNSRGDFQCKGVWYMEKCTHNGGGGHEINPYESKDHRIIFSTWNLDHRIERSRTIIPTVIKCISLNGVSRINTSYLFEILFTTRNIRLVHIVCHDKGTHETAKCDLKEMSLI